MENNNEIRIPTISNIRLLIEPILGKLETIEAQLKNKVPAPTTKKFFRNQDLKSNYGLSNNTIIKYRENGTLPFTRIGDVYLYDIKEIEAILTANKVK